MTAPIRYIMKGVINSPPYNEVTWSVWNTPDFTGAQSGFSGLINIVVDYQSQENITSGGQSGNAPQPPIPSPPIDDVIAPKIKYTMKGTKKTIPFDMVTWSIWNVPDFNGEFSGYGIDNLENIVIDYTTVDDVSRGPQALPIINVLTGPAGGDLSGVFPSPTVIGLHGRLISSVAPTNQFVLTWNSSTSKWEPAAPLGGPPSGSAGGDLSGSYPNPSVINIQGKPISATAPTINQILEWNGASWTPADNAALGPAGGDLSGTYPNPTVVALESTTTSINVGSATAPTANQVLTATDSTHATWKDIDAIKIRGKSLASSLSSVGASQDGYVLTWINGSSDWEAKPFTTAIGTAGGDLSGTYPDPIVARTRALKSATTDVNVDAATAPVAGQVLVANSSTAATWQTPTGFPAGPAGGDLSGTYPNPTVAKIQTKSLDPALASISSVNDGYFLAWRDSNSRWEAFESLDMEGAVEGNATANASVLASNNRFTTNKYISHGGVSLALKPMCIANPLSGNTNDVGAGYYDLALFNNSGHLPLQFAYNPGATFLSDANLDLRSSLIRSYPWIKTGAAAGVLTTDRYLILGASSSPSAASLYLVENVSTTGFNIIVSIGGIGGVSIPPGQRALVTSIQGGEFVLASTLAGAPTGSAGGDLSGTYPNPTVTRASGLKSATTTVSVSAATAPTANQVLTAVNSTTASWQSLPTTATPIGSAGGNLSGTYPNPTVIKINGTTISSAGGALTTGKILQVTGASTADYGAVDLANSNAVTGVLPTANQAVQSLTGDASGTTAAVQVDLARGLKSATTTVSVSAATAPTANQVLTATNSTTATWQTIPTQTATGTAGGDLSGTYPNPTVIALQGRAVFNGAPTDQYVLTWVAANNRWEAAISGSGSGGPPSGSAGGDLSGTYPNPTVARIQSAKIVVKTSNYTITTTDYIIMADTSGAAFNLTLPTPSIGMVYIIKDNSGNFETNNLTLVRAGTEKIEGVAASRVLTANYGNYTIFSDGTDWYLS